MKKNKVEKVVGKTFFISDNMGDMYESMQDVMDAINGDSNVSEEIDDVIFGEDEEEYIIELKVVGIYRKQNTITKVQ